MRFWTRILCKDIIIKVFCESEMGFFFNSKTINSKMNTSKIKKNNDKQRKKNGFLMINFEKY